MRSIRDNNGRNCCFNAPPFGFAILKREFSFTLCRHRGWPSNGHLATQLSPIRRPDARQFLRNLGSAGSKPARGENSPVSKESERKVASFSITTAGGIL